MNKEDLVRTVAEDLQYLRSEWDWEITDDSLRRSSIVLRRLLVENDFQRAWKKVGLEKQATIHANAIPRAYLVEPGINYIMIAAAGGAWYHGMFIQKFIASPIRLPDDKEEVVGRPFGLREFVESPAMIIESQILPRRVLIKYVANTQGGAHLNAKRANDQEGKLFTLLDQVKSLELGVANKDLIYYELLAIGQSLAQATDVERFLVAAGQQPAPLRYDRLPAN
jgi:hypothetical protein